MRYSFTKDELGWQRLTVAKPTPNDKGLTPTEAENILNQLQEELFGELIQNKYKLNINISPKVSRKLDDTVIEFIKKQERNYSFEKRGEEQFNYRYYALTLYALQKLNYVCEDGRLVTQTRLSNAIGIRRATLNKYFNNLQYVEQDETYLEIEQDLFNL